MSTITDIHDFFAAMTYGHDRGVTAIWLTPSMFDRLYGEINGLIRTPRFDERTTDWREFLPSRGAMPTFIEFEGIKIFRAD